MTSIHQNNLCMSKILVRSKIEQQLCQQGACSAAVANGIIMAAARDMSHLLLASKECPLSAPRFVFSDGRCTDGKHSLTIFCHVPVIVALRGTESKKDSARSERAIVTSLVICSGHWSLEAERRANNERQCNRALTTSIIGKDAQ